MNKLKQLNQVLNELSTKGPVSLRRVLEGELRAARERLKGFEECEDSSEVSAEREHIRTIENRLEGKF